MNAVKNCLVVLAAAVALASCSADPNNSSAGKATLTVSPGSVAMRANTTAEVFASAMDPLGGAVNGTFTLTGNGTGSDTTVFKAAIDTSYTPVLGGARPQQRTRIVVTAKTSGDGSFTITGTGGTVRVPVRVAPDSLLGDIAVSKTTLAEIDTFTATLRPGVRFTHGTTVNVYHQATSADSALFSPVLVSISADSQTATVAVGPNSGGHVRFDGLANTSTPTITYAARAATLITSPTLDTTGTDSTTGQVANVRISSVAPIVKDTIHAAIGDTFTATAPAGWRFTPATTVHIYKGPTVNDSTDGVAQPHFVSISPDSSTVKFIPAPDAKGQARFTHMVLQSNPAQYQYAAARSLEKLVVPHLPFTPAIVRANTTPNAVATFTMPAGVKLTPASVPTVPGFLNPILLTRSADSTQMTMLLPPLMSKNSMTFSHLRATAVPFFDLTLPTDTVISTAAATDQGNDNPSAGAVPTINMPTLGSYGIWDVGTFTVQDSSDDNGWQFGFPSVNSQVYQLNLGVAATIVATVTYPSSAADVDVVILQGSGSTNLPDVSTGGTSASHPEVSTAAGLSAGPYLLDLIDWGGDPLAFGPGAGAVGATLRIAVVAQ